MQKKRANAKKDAFSFKNAISKCKNCKKANKKGKLQIRDLLKSAKKESYTPNKLEEILLVKLTFFSFLRFLYLAKIAFYLFINGIAYKIQQNGIFNQKNAKKRIKIQKEHIQRGKE